MRDMLSKMFECGFSREPICLLVKSLSLHDTLSAGVKYGADSWFHKAWKKPPACVICWPGALRKKSEELFLEKLADGAE